MQYRCGFWWIQASGIVNSMLAKKRLKKGCNKINPAAGTGSSDSSIVDISSAPFYFMSVEWWMTLSCFSFTFCEVLNRIPKELSILDQCFVFFEGITSGSHEPINSKVLGRFVACNCQWNLGPRCKIEKVLLSLLFPFLSIENGHISFDFGLVLEISSAKIPMKRFKSKSGLLWQRNEMPIARRRILGFEGFWMLKAFVFFFKNSFKK